MINVNDIDSLKIYESELWSGIDIIKDNEVIYKNILNSLIYTYSAIESIELNYYEELNHLGDLLYIPEVQNTLISALNANKIFIKEKANKHKAFSESVHKIAEELKESVILYSKTIPEVINNNRKSTEIFNSEMEKLEIIKKEYYDQSGKATQRYKEYKEYEDTKKNKAQAAKKLYEKELAEAQNKEKNYLREINRMNGEREKYINAMNSYLKKCQGTDWKYIQTVQSCIQNYINIENKLLSEINDLSNELNKNINSIDIISDLKQFASTNRTHRAIPQKIDFSPYSSALSNVQSLFDYTIQPTIVETLHRFLNETFNYKTPELEGDNSFNYQLLEEYATSIRNGTITKEATEQLDKFLLNSSSYRLFFLRNLNRMRGKYPSLSKNTFEIVTKLLRFIVIKSLENKEYDLIRYVIILSETFYTITEKVPKLLIQEEMKADEFWQNESLWRELIRSQIISDIGFQKKKPIQKKDFDSQCKMTLYSVLLTFKFNMQSFDVSVDSINKLMEEYSKEYNVSEEEKAMLIISKKRNQNNRDTPNSSIMLNVIEKEEKLELINTDNISSK